MNSGIFLDNKKYISAKEASVVSGYSQDYIGQLARANKIESKRFGRVWYVSEESILNYKNFPLNQTQQPETEIIKEGLAKDSIKDIEKDIEQEGDLIHQNLIRDFINSKKSLALDLSLNKNIKFTKHAKLVKGNLFSNLGNTQNLAFSITSFLLVVTLFSFNKELMSVGKNISSLASNFLSADVSKAVPKITSKVDSTIDATVDAYKKYLSGGVKATIDSENVISGWQSFVKKDEIKEETKSIVNQNSVIKNNTVASVSSVSVLSALRSLLSKEIPADILLKLRGASGPQGERGIAGPQGLSGASGYTFSAQPPASPNPSGPIGVMGGFANLGTQELNTKTLTASSDITQTGGSTSLKTLTTNGALTVTGDTSLSGAISIAGAATLSSTLSVTGASTFTGILTSTGQIIITRSPTEAHVFAPSWPSGTSNVSNSTLYINPASATADANLLGLAVNGTPKFIVDAEGDIYGTNLILTGSTSTGATTVGGNLTVQDNTALGDAVTDTIAFNGSANTNLTFNKADPSIIFNTTTATDTDFWFGVQEDAGGDDDDVFQIGDGTTPGTNPFLTINTSGNVGIGNVSPGEKLSVTGNAAFSGYVTAGDTTWGFNAANDVPARFGSNQDNSFSIGYNSAGDYLKIAEDALTNTAIMVWDTNGNVGIGDITPAAMFTVGNGDLFQVISTGHVRSIAGVAGGPAYSFTADTNSGMYSGGTNILGFSTNSAARMTIDADGEVGIGTASPSQPLEVSKSQNALTQAQVTNATNGTSGRSAFTAQMATAGNEGLISMQAISPLFTDVTTWANTGALVTGISGGMVLSSFDTAGIIKFQTGGNAVSNERMRITSDGKVGIGFSTPVHRLHVQSLSGATGNTYWTTADYNDVNTGSGMLLDFGAASGNTYTRLQAFSNGSALTNNLVLNPNGGYVGIGLTDPNVALDISSAQAGVEIVSTAGTNNAYIRYGNSGGSFYVGRDGSAGNTLLAGSSAYAAVFGSGGAYPMQFGTNDTVRMTIGATGNVGIGTTDPGALLDLDQGSGDTQILALGSSDVAHGITTITETDNFGVFRKTHATDGGLTIESLADALDAGGGMMIRATVAADSSDANPYMWFRSGLKSGTATGDADAGQVIYQFQDGTGDPLLSLTQDGNIGIGTNTPGTKLNVKDGDFAINTSTGVEANYQIRDADVTHPFTALGGVFSSINTNTSTVLSQTSGTDGGAVFAGFRDTAGAALLLQGHVNGDSTTAAAVALDAYKTDGGTGRTSIISTSRLFDIRNAGSALVTVLGSGNVGIGTTDPGAKLSVSGAGYFGAYTTNGTGNLYVGSQGETSAIYVDTADNATRGAMFAGRAARGTQASRTILQSGDEGASFQSYGYDGASYLRLGSIRTYVDGTPGTNDMPGRIVFSTTPDGSTTDAERLRIDNAGNFIFNEDGNNSDFRIESDTNANLLMIDASQNNIGFGAAPNSRYFADFGGAGGNAFTSGATGGDDSAYALFRPASVANTSGTGNIANVIISGGTSLNPTGASTWGAGLIVGGPSEGGAGSFTNMASLLIEDAPSAGSNNYSLYSAGSAKSYFAGNVGVGNTSPSADFVVGTTDSILLSNNYDGGGGYAGDRTGLVLTEGSVRSSFHNYSNGDGATVMGSETNHRVDLVVNNSAVINLAVGGFVGIADASPDAQLDINYDSTAAVGQFINNTYNGNGTAMSFRVVDAQVGSIAVTTSATSFNTSSDVRLKENILDTVFGLEVLSQIKVRDYNFISNPQDRMQGFIAQELYEIYPDAVTVGGDDPKDNPWSVDYSKLVPLVIKSVQEIDLKITDLDSRISALENGGGAISSFGEYVNDFLDTILVKVENGVGYLTALAVDSLRVGSPEKPAGIQMFDPNGSPYCVKVMVGGVLASEPGNCEPVVEEIPLPEPSPEPSPEPTPTPDTTPPVITLNGESTLNITISGVYEELGATATDDVDGNVAVVITGSVDTNTLGVYTIHYNTSDTAGNSATEVIRTVNVIE